MKPGGSGLNPNAAAYVPLYKRETDSTKPAAAAATHDVQHQPYGYGVQGKGSFPGSHMRDDDSEMEMEFLLASFSNLSDESICDVYLANNGDLDATIKMLTQHENECSEEYEKDGYSEMQRKNDVECEEEERTLFQIRMELGEEIGRGHFDYGCSPKLKKERLLLDASQNLRFGCSLFQIRMELGKEIGRGHFDYGCSPKLKKERFMLQLALDERHEVRYEDGYTRGSDARIEWERREDFCFCSFEGNNYEGAQGREMYHYKRRKGRAHQDSMQEDGKDGVG
ncbi:hypothetical protein DY000_02038197 [Brassica cretica]|uniref:CUE domain-containing protein n=1 Tax=Brassica cretica TaxID=69181 RepID=A0ABQ7BJ19_BRACR|nr:hypothetical protein DY000_02038197 [Brassica cretica]